MDQVTASRATQDPAWIEQSKLIDWMSAPGMAEYVNALVSGRPLHEGGHWGLHAFRTHLAPLAAKRGRPLSMLTLGCGDGHIEKALIQEFQWPIGRMVGLEYDQALRTAFLDRFAGIGSVESRAAFFDFNDISALDPPGQFDVVFCCHALHHATDVEGMLGFINASMVPDGLFMGLEYLGPTRFQIDPEVLGIIRTLFGLLPPHLRRNLLEPDAPQDTFEVPTIADLRRADPSESVRSSDLRALLFASFPIVELKPMGGTLLRWLLQYRAGNFQGTNPEHVAMIRLLQIIEQTLIETRRIQSDDMFFVLSRSGRFA